MRDLRVQAAGIGARGQRVEIVALDQRDRHAVGGQVIGGGAAGQAAADHDHVRIEAAIRRNHERLPTLIRSL